MLFPNWSRLMQRGPVRRSGRPLNVTSVEIFGTPNRSDGQRLGNVLCDGRDYRQ